MKDFIQTIKGLSVENLILQLAEVSVDMCKKQGYIRNVAVQMFMGSMLHIVRTELFAWDIHTIIYYAICNSNDFRNSKTNYSFEQIVALYRKFENDELTPEDLKIADLSGVLKIVFGLASEQLPFEQMGWVYENFNRNYHILVASDKINRNLSVTLKQIIKEKFGWSLDEYYSVLLIVYWLSRYTSVPLSTPATSYHKKEDTVLTKENIEKFVRYYSCSYNEVRSSPIKKQIFYSKPFIHTDKSGVYIASNAFLVISMIGNSLYWIVRDYYNDLNSQEFLNTFGTMFEDYIKELAEKYLSPNQWRVIPTKKKNKSADFYFDFGNAALVVEQKASLVQLSVKQQSPDINALNKFIANTITEAYKQIQASCIEIKTAKPIIKIILLYDTAPNIGMLESVVPEIFASDDSCYLVTSMEIEIMFYLWKTDQPKLYELLEKMLAGKKDNPFHVCSVTKIYHEMNLYSLHGIARELDYFQKALINLGKELGVDASGRYNIIT